MSVYNIMILVHACSFVHLNSVLVHISFFYALPFIYRNWNYLDLFNVTHTGSMSLPSVLNPI